MGPDKVESTELALVRDDHIRELRGRDLVRELHDGRAVWIAGSQFPVPRHEKSHAKCQRHLSSRGQVPAGRQG